MPRSSKPTGPKPVETYRHDDKRTNIPTNELRGFVEGDEAQPGRMLYPRDPSLDPQLVWTGKDEQDAHDLEVPVVPIYIQEKILPQVFHSGEGLFGPAWLGQHAASRPPLETARGSGCVAS
jgi:adenine-specific DNA-methyltransferase